MNRTPMLLPLAAALAAALTLAPAAAQVPDTTAVRSHAPAPTAPRAAERTSLRES